MIFVLLNLINIRSIVEGLAELPNRGGNGDQRSVGWALLPVVIVADLPNEQYLPTDLD